MKKAISLTLVLFIMLCFAACGEGITEESELPEQTNPLSDFDLDLIINEMKNALDTGEVPYQDVSIMEYNNKPQVEVDLSNSASITYFGHYVYYAMEAYDNTLRDIGVSRVLLQMPPQNGSTSILFVSDSAGVALGTVTDGRSGETKTTVVYSYEELSEIFPALTLLLDEVNADANNDLAGEEDVLNQIRTYPLKSTSPYLADAIDLDEIIFSTTGSENGLIGTVYSFHGVVVNDGVIDNVDYIIVETSFGNVSISNFYTYMYEYNETAFSLIVEEEDADYSFPEIGEEADFICVYGGFSEVLNLPSLQLGANAFLVEEYLAEKTDTNEDDVSDNDYSSDTTSGQDTDTTQAIESSAADVYIPSSGTKYHNNSSCSNMKNPSKVTIEYAKSMGYTACKKCYGG